MEGYFYYFVNQKFHELVPKVLKNSMRFSCFLTVLVQFRKGNIYEIALKKMGEDKLSDIWIVHKAKMVLDWAKDDSEKI